MAGSDKAMVGYGPSHVKKYEPHLLNPSQKTLTTVRTLFKNCYCDDIILPSGLVRLGLMTWVGIRRDNKI